MTPADLSALRALADAATPGPWKPGVYWRDGAYPIGPYTRNEATAKADAAFIAATRNALPSLLSHVAAQAERIEALEAFAKEWADEECCYGDGCPTFGGTRHGTCTPCNARRVLGGKEGT